MQNKQARQGRAMSMTGGVFCGVSWGSLITLASIAMLAKLVDTEVLQWESVGYGIMITLMICSFISAEIAVKKVKRREILVCVISAITYLCILLIITALLFGGTYYAVGETALLIAGSSGLAALKAANSKNKHHRKKHF